jgi:hypothetical protein
VCELKTGCVCSRCVCRVVSSFNSKGLQGLGVLAVCKADSKQRASEVGGNLCCVWSSGRRSSRRCCRNSNAHKRPSAGSNNHTSQRSTGGPARHQCPSPQTHSPPEAAERGQKAHRRRSVVFIFRMETRAETISKSAAVGPQPPHKISVY